MPRRPSALPRLLFALSAALVLGMWWGAPSFAAEPPEVIGAQLGLGGGYKLGCWAPLRVQMRGGSEATNVAVVALTPDNDALGVATTSPGSRPIGLEPGAIAEQRLYVRVGKSYAPLEVRLMRGPRVLDKRTFRVGATDPSESLDVGVSATEKLLLEIGGDFGAEPLLKQLTPDNGWGTSRACRVTDAAELPLDWIGYEGFDAVVLGVGQRDWWRGLAPGDPRIVALRQWVEMGGKLILSCGANGAEACAPDGPLAGLLPGVFDGVATLSRADAIERYTDAQRDPRPIDLEGTTLTVTRLRDVTGVVEAREGREQSALPLVVRAPLGFGEVTFVAMDLDHPLIGAWPGRSELIGKLLLGVVRPDNDDQGNQTLAYQSHDLVTRLIRVLDNSFTDVASTPFLVVVLLVIGYLGLIGPGDYFFVKRVLGRTEATWITFPLIVLLTCAGAYAAASWLKGDDLLVNQIEVIDTIASSGQTRGTVITHLFSPRAERYNFELKARSLQDEDLRAETSYTSWLGKPGHGLGGMQASAKASLGWRPDYLIDPTPALTAAAQGATAPAVQGMPVQVWSTKTALSRWSGRVDRTFEADLSPDGDGLVEGSLTNDCGAFLSDCCLIYGDWAWRLGDMSDGETKQIDPGRAPLRLSTLMRQSLFSRKGGDSQGDDSLSSLHNFYWDPPVSGLGDMLSFGDRLDRNKEWLPQAHLSHTRLSHHLDAGRAVLIGQRNDGPASELVRDGASLFGDEVANPKNKSWVFCRFILEVGAE